MNVLVLMPYLYDTAPGQRFRIEQWARMLAPEGVRFEFVPFYSPRLQRILHVRGHHHQKAAEVVKGVLQRARFVASLKRGWDVIFLHRELAPFGPPFLERLLVGKGIPLVYDFDDAIFLPDVSEANQAFQSLKWVSKTATICRLASHVVVGNRYLADYARCYTDRVSTIPTTVDVEAYAPKADVHVGDIPVIGWSGSVSTVKHLRTLAATLRRLRERVRYRLKVVGTPDFALPGVDVEAKPWNAGTEVEDLQSFDVGLMPLPDDAWSRGKCGLKALQYMAVGVPTVASPIGVNCEIIDDGHNGFLASSEDEWIEKISTLLTDESVRGRLAKEGRRTVEERYAGRVQAPRLLSIFTSLLP